MPCENCRELERKLRECEARIAEERAKADAVARSLTAAVLPPPKPLRYEVADKLNDALKRVLPWAHKAIKR